MTISPRRQRLAVGFGLLLLAGLGWVAWPFIVGPGRKQGFCSSLTVGTSLAQLQAQAEQEGYRVSAPIEGRRFVHEPRSFGRFTCTVQFGPDGLESAVYSLND